MLRQIPLLLTRQGIFYIKKNPPAHEATTGWLVFGGEHEVLTAAADQADEPAAPRRRGSSGWWAPAEAMSK
jgi:hypothetical protein